MVTTLALVAIVGVVLIAVLALPSDQLGKPSEQGPSIVAIAGAAFGVVGGTVGAFFSVKSATDALARARRDRLAKSSSPSTEETDRGESTA
jgi:hypothetical protein